MFLISWLVSHWWIRTARLQVKKSAWSSSTQVHVDAGRDPREVWQDSASRSAKRQTDKTSKRLAVMARSRQHMRLRFSRICRENAILTLLKIKYLCKQPRERDTCSEASCKVVLYRDTGSAKQDRDQFLALYLVRRASYWVSPMQKILFAYTKDIFCG